MANTHTQKDHRLCQNEPFQENKGIHGGGCREQQRNLSVHRVRHSPPTYHQGCLHQQSHWPGASQKQSKFAVKADKEGVEAQSMALGLLAVKRLVAYYELQSKVNAITGTAELATAQHHTHNDHTVSI